MKPSTYALIVFVIVGVLGAWQLVRYKRNADAQRVPAALDAGER